MLADLIDPLPMNHPWLVDRARDQRQIMSKVEERLWYHLRGRRFLGHKFRRQVPIGPFIADFACKQARLVIETDGDQHGTDEQEMRDARRTEWFEEHGWRVMRFWTSELAASMEDALELIFNTLEEAGLNPPFSEPSS